MTSCLGLVLTQGTFNTLRPRQDGLHFPDDIYKCIFLNENIWILIKISLKFAPHGPINNIPALVQIMAWRRPGGHYLNQWWLVYWCIYASHGLNELTHCFPYDTLAHTAKHFITSDSGKIQTNNDYKRDLKQANIINCNEISGTFSYDITC